MHPDEGPAWARIFRDYALHIVSLLTCIVAYKVTDSIRPVVKSWDWKEFLLVCAVFPTIVFAFQSAMAILTGASVIQRAKVIYGAAGAILTIGLLVFFCFPYLVAGFLFSLGLGAVARSAQNPGKIGGYALGPIFWGVGLWFSWKHFVAVVALFLGMLAMLVAYQRLRGVPLSARPGTR